jgi:hypothetical protein
MLPHTLALVVLTAVACSDDGVTPPTTHGGEWHVALEYTSYGSLWGTAHYRASPYLIAVESRGYRHGQRLVRYQNGVWQPFTDELPSITGMSATSPEDIYVSSSWGGAHRFDGEKWITLPAEVEELDRLESVWANAPNDVYFVGWSPDGGLVFHYRGKTVSKVQVVTHPLRDVWGIGEDVFAVGDLGQILHFDGSQWNLSNEPVSNLYDVWGMSKDDVYAVGWYGAILHFDGDAWEPAVTGRDNEDFLGVWGRSSKDVYVAGSKSGGGEGEGIILHFDGTNWTEVYRDPNDVYLGSVYSLPGVPIFVAGSGLMLQSTATGWDMTYRTTDQTLQSVWVSPTGEVFVSGSFSEIFHFDGSEWERVRTGTYPKHLNQIRGSDSGNVCAVGQGGTIVRYDGNTWQTIPGPTTDWITDIWETGTGELLISGEKGLIARYDGNQWTIDRQSPPELTGETIAKLWVFADDDIYGIRNVWNSEEISTHVIHFDGSVWADIPFAQLPGNQRLYGIWGSDTGELFVSGSSWAGKFDGGSWQELAFDQEAGLGAIWGRSSTDVFFAGTQGLVYHYDGSRMEPMPTGVLDNLTSIWGSDDGDVFAVSSSGTIVQYSVKE